MKIVYIHGASATSESFNYIRSKLGKGIDIDYDSRNGFENNLQDMSEQLKNVKVIKNSVNSIVSGSQPTPEIKTSIPEKINTCNKPEGDKIKSCRKYSRSKNKKTLKRK